ncbi:hypothetical protein AYO40_00105 [Planctomycetaceae bacterium SCGC AG-212-D15]|nr:hypothetical protein AYO40_00105 [Planctomycetaceae bacterium SCGC AG-212-D15]
MSSLYTQTLPRRACASTLAVLIAAGAGYGAEPDRNAPRSRTFVFTYAGAVTGLTPDKTARIWLPMATTNSDQIVKVLAKELPAKGEINRDAVYGNQVLFFEAAANKDGEIPFSIKYHVLRREVAKEPGDKEIGGSIERLLQPDAKVPIAGKPLDLIKDKELPKDQVDMARLFYDVVNKHMKYSKEGTGWGRGDSVWACESGFGNCTDFHSLFISLARSQKIPARFIIGFPLPEKHGEGEIPGYHCWAKFKPEGKDWVPVDISEANKNPKMREYYFGHLTPDRVDFSTGRDLTLMPKQAAGPLNFLIYPYVEVDGKPYDKVKRKFSFKDEEMK